MWVIDFFLPPKQGSSPGEIFQWQWKVTSSLLLILIVGVWTLKNVAWAGDMATLKGEFADMRSEGKRNSLETQLRQISTDLFNLKQQVADVRAKGKYPDQLYLIRISELENDKARLERELQGLR